MSSERRITHRLVDYWQQIKGDRVVPSERDVDSHELADMWDNCFFVHVRQAEGFGQHYSLGYVGKELSQLYREGAENEQAYLLPLPLDKISQLYNEMMLTKLPIVENVEDFVMNGRILKYRLCLLPMGEQNGELQGILGGLRYKIF